MWIADFQKYSNNLDEGYQQFQQVKINQFNGSRLCQSRRLKKIYIELGASGFNGR
jgi:hypothetical protein